MSFHPTAIADLLKKAFN